MTTTTVKPKGILFKGEMVLAIWEGRKTQTRRLVKPQPTSPLKPWPKEDSCVCIMDVEAAPAYYAECGLLPHKPGDVLYLKETYYNDCPGQKDLDSVYYRADGECCQQIPECQCASVGKVKWTPSIFMPRWAARLWLVVTEVRCERLQDISEEDAIAEGVELLKPGFWKMYDCKEGFGVTAKRSYESLWESINKNPGTRWEDNPWVFAYTFKRTEAP